MRNLIPEFIYRQYQAGRHAGQFQAASLFVDISGFTALTESLMYHRKHGAEILTKVLNDTFHDLVQVVYRHGGFISSFAGDAFTALFPSRRQDAALHAVQVAFLLRQHFAEHGLFHPAYGQYSLNVKCGLGVGRVEWRIVGQEGRYTYFFRGKAVDDCAHAEHCADQGDIVAGPDLMPLIEAQVQAEPAGDCFRLTGHTLKLPDKQIKLAHLSEDDLRAFVLDAVIDLTAAGEFRDIAGVFVSFEEPQNSLALNAFIGHVMRTAVSYGGYFNKLDFGDKGGVILLLFGAPVAYENNIQRAADFLLALRMHPDQPVQWRAGLTCGVVYAGFIGGTERSEYTAIGDMVNLSARIMMATPWNAIWVSQPVAEQLSPCIYQLEPAGDFAFKGKTTSVKVSHLVGRRQAFQATALYGSGFVGREFEISQLYEWVRPIFSGEFGGAIHIDGEIGIGKSRLVYELERQLSAQHRLKWLACPADSILRLSFNPFQHMLRHYFAYSQEQTSAENRTLFMDTLETLISDLPATEQANELRTELRRTMSFLAALIGLQWEDSLYAELDPKLRYENTLIALKTLIKAESLRQPVVVHIEDTHWLDPDSQTMIQHLTRNIEGCPFVVLLTARCNDDGSPFRIPLEDPNAPHHAIDLGKLSAAGIRQLAAQTLDGEITDDLAEFLREKTDGNPFFVEQLALDLKENGTLIKNIDGAWATAAHQELAEIPSSIGAVLIARLDRLAAQVKTLVQTAAVLGREFEVRVLSQMLKDDREVLPRIQLAETEGIWWAVGELRYLFRHALLRDAAYDMQLRARLRNLHELAATTLEQIYASDLTPYLADLAYHFSKAEKVEPTFRYTRLAAERAITASAYREAQATLEQGLRVLNGVKTTPEIVLNKAVFLQLLGDSYAAIGDNEQAEANYRSGLEFARSLGRMDEIAGMLIGLGDVADATGNYANAQQHYQEALKNIDPYTPEQARVLRGMGNVSVHRGAFVEAEEHFQRSLSISREVGDRDGMADGLHGLGYVAHSRGDYPNAVQHFQQSLEVRRETGNRNRLASTLSNLGVTHYYQGHYTEAVECYQQSLAIQREVGDRSSVSKILNNLGLILYNNGDFAGAEPYYLQSLALDRETGDRAGVATSLNNLAGIAQFQGKFDLAIERCQQSLAIRTEIGDRVGIAFSLGTLGVFTLEKGDFEEAGRYLAESLEMQHEIGDRQGASITLVNLVACQVKLERLEKAREYLHEGLTMSLAMASRPIIALFLGSATELAIHTGQYRRGAELCALVVEGPDIEQMVRDEAVKMRPDLEAALPPEEFVMAWERGKGLDVEVVAAEILAELDSWAV